MQTTVRILLAAVLALPLFLGLQGCSDYDGSIEENQPPEVDFVNVHDNSESTIYDFAPVIHWKGSDPDGFVEFYSYADITDSAAIENPVEYIQRIPDEAWVDTIATQATIKLLSQAGTVTEHVFYVRAEDNDGAQSDVKYRRFFRTNSAPNIPRIGLAGTDEGEFSTRYTVEDTLYTAPTITNVYPGIEFSWRGSDPDDKALFTIPLEYQAILVKSPAETLFVNPWTDEVDIQLVDLETGFYTLNVWARDDGLTKSVAPARAEFNVIRPTFENDLLMVFESLTYRPGEPGIANPNQPDTAAVREFYVDLLQDVAPNVQFTDLDLADANDVRFMRVSNSNATLPRELLAQYRLVIFTADHAMTANDSWRNTAYMDNKYDVLSDYLRVGGRVWQMGRFLSVSGMAPDPQGQAQDGQQVKEEFFGMTLIQPENDAGPFPYSAPPKQPGDTPTSRADFVGTISALTNTFPSLVWDSTKADQNFYNSFVNFGEPNYYQDDWGMSGVDRIAREEQATTTQYFDSGSFGTERLVEDEDALVQDLDNTLDEYEDIVFYPTATNAYIVLANNNVQSVNRVYNATLDVEAEVVVINDDLVQISYDEGQPWANDHDLEVDYVYNPLSEMHLKPVEIRLEGQQGGNQINPFPVLRFRTALSTFSYYFIEKDEAVTAWTLMLNWFYNPSVNDAVFNFQ